MEELLSLLLQQNERMLAALESIDEKLDALADIKFAVDNLSNKVDLLEVLQPGLIHDVTSIRGSVESIDKELRWYEELSFAKQLISSVDSVTNAVQK